jgi:hypothetical protein
MTEEFNQRKAWSVFEYYAEGDFNEVADYSYSTLDSFLQSSIEFIPKKKFEEYKKALIKSQN